jgi:hypothetical protein
MKYLGFGLHRASGIFVDTHRVLNTPFIFTGRSCSLGRERGFSGDTHRVHKTQLGRELGIFGVTHRVLKTPIIFTSRSCSLGRERGISGDTHRVLYTDMVVPKGTGNRECLLGHPYTSAT